MLNNSSSNMTFRNCLNNSDTNSTVCALPEVKRGIWTPDVIQRVITLGVIMTLTFIGNMVIIIILTKTRQRKRNSRVNLFIINLAVGDLAVCCITMTTELLFVVFGEWILGNVACKLLTYSQVVTLSSTTFILTSMSIDRYMALCCPLRFYAGTSKARTKRMILVSWILSFVFSIPQLLIFHQTVEASFPDGSVRYGCRSLGYTAQWQRKLYISFMTSYILIIPSVIISFCYIKVVMCVWRQSFETTLKNIPACRKTVVNTASISKAKIKTVKMTLTIITIFIICWTPYFLTTLIRIYSDYKYVIPKTVMVFSETIALLQSALNPILYGFFNIKFKRGILEICCPWTRIRFPTPTRHTCVTEITNYTDMCTFGGVHYSNSGLSSRKLYVSNSNSGLSEECKSRDDTLYSDNEDSKFLMLTPQRIRRNNRPRAADLAIM